MKKWVLIILFILPIQFLNGQNCLGTQSYTISPTGPYTSGDTINVDYTLNNFIQVNVNWIIAFQINKVNSFAFRHPSHT